MSTYVYVIMPYRRRAPQRKYRRRPAQRTAYVRKVARSEAKKVVRRNVETKSHDEVFNLSVSSTLVANDVCATLTRGSSDSDFLGAYIKPVYMTIKYQMTGADAFNVVRMIIIQDKDSSGTPVAGTLFENTSWPTLSSFATNYRDTYKVIYDRRFSLKQDSATYFAPVIGTIKVPLRKLRRIKFNDTGGILGGKLWVILVSDSTAVSHPTVYFYTRLYFTDA